MHHSRRQRQAWSTLAKPLATTTAFKLRAIAGINRGPRAAYTGAPSGPTYRSIAKRDLEALRCNNLGCDQPKLIS